METHTLIYYGGGEVMFYIIRALTTLLSDKGFCHSMFRIIGLVGVCWCTIQMAYTRNPKGTLVWFSSFIILTTFVYSARVHIRVKDKVTGFERDIQGVPWVWAKPAYLLNTFSHTLSKKVDQLFQTLPGGGEQGAGFNINYLPYYETGTVFASKMISKVRHFKVVDPIFNGNLERFINQCVVFDALIGRKYTMKDLLNERDLWTLVKNHASPVMGFSYKDPEGDHRSEIVSCRAGALKLEAKWEEELSDAAKRYGKAFFPHKDADAKAAFISKLPQSYGLLTKVTRDANKILQQSMMMNAISRAPNKKLSELGSPINYATTKTLLQQRSNFTIAGEVARDSLPIIKVVMEALTYASFIFIFFIALFPGGFRVFRTYFEMILSLQMWPLLYSILNFIMTIYGRAKTSSFGEMTMMNATAIGEINADIAAYAGYWSMLVPIFSYMITKGGVGSMVHAAGHIGSAFMAASSGAANEVTSGNISLGNLQYGTQSILNSSGFKHDMSFMHRDNQIENLMSDGTSRVIQPNGEAVFRGGAGHSVSQMGLRAMSQEYLSKNTTEALSHAEGVMQSQNEEWGRSRQQMTNQVVSSAGSILKSIQSGNAIDMSEGSSMTQSLQNVEDFQKQVQNKYGLSESQSNQITAALAFGRASEGVVKPSLGFHFNNQAERSAVYDELKSLSDRHSLQDSVETVASGMQRVSFGENTGQESRLSQDIQASYQDSESMRESASKAQQYHDNLNHAVQTLKSGGINIERDETQDLLNYVADQTYQGHRIGYDTAYKMLSRNDPMSNAYVEDYRQQKWNAINESLQGSDHVMSEGEIKKLYSNPVHYGSMMKQESPMEETFKGNAETIKKGSDLEHVVPNREAQTQYADQKSRIAQEMESRQMKQMDQSTLSKKAHKKHTNRTITGEMIRNLKGGIDRDI